MITAAPHNHGGQMTMRRTNTFPAETTILPVHALILALVCIVIPASGQDPTGGGNAFAWGSYLATQPANIHAAQDHVPARLPGLDHIMALAACGGYSLAVQPDGTVWTWDEGSVPVRVRGLHSVTAVACGSSHNIALRLDGTVWTWGGNPYGHQGAGAAGTVPLQVPGLGDVIAVAAGADHSLALQSDGTVRAWGANNHGQLGDGGYTNVDVPVLIAQLHGMVAIAG